MCSDSIPIISQRLFFFSPSTFRCSVICHYIEKISLFFWIRISASNMQQNMAASIHSMFIVMNLAITGKMVNQFMERNNIVNRQNEYSLNDCMFATLPATNCTSIHHSLNIHVSHGTCSLLCWFYFAFRFVFTAIMTRNDDNNNELYVYMCDQTVVIVFKFLTI